MSVAHVPVVGILSPGHSAEDDYPRAERMLGSSVSLPVVHTTVGIDTHEIEALIDTGSPERLRERLGIPVLTANQVLIDAALRRTGALPVA